jgi:hypothetical protein
MIDRSLTRLGLLTNLLLIPTALTLSYERPDLRSPGEEEGEGAPASGRWCGKCGRGLDEELMSSGSIYSCPNHGALDDEDICSSPPRLWCGICGKDLELKRIPSCPTHGEIDVTDILTSPPARS